MRQPYGQQRANLKSNPRTTKCGDSSRGAKNSAFESAVVGSKQAANKLDHGGRAR